MGPRGRRATLRYSRGAVRVMKESVSSTASDRPSDAAPARSAGDSDAGEASGRRRGKWRWLRGLVGLGLLGGVLATLDLDAFADALVGVRWLPCAAGLVLLLGIRVVRAARWRDLLAAYGVRRSLLRLTALVFVGHFFNLFLPTSVGGDLARGYLAAPEDDQVALSYGVVVVERFLGFVTLALVTAGATVVAMLTSAGSIPSPLLHSVGAASLAALTMGAAAFAWSGWHGWTRRRVQRWLGSVRAIRIFDGLTAGFDVLRRREAPRGRIIALSLLVHLVAIAFYVAVAAAIELPIPYLAFFLVVPVASVAAALPVSINGLGVREGVFVALIAALGANPSEAGAFAVLALLLQTVVSLSGGLVYTLHPGLRRRS